jgi:hypothetical protein
MFTYIKRLIKQARYYWLSRMDTDNQTDAQIAEQTELYYELYV